MNEHEPRPAHAPDGLDLRRLEVAAARLADHIETGITLALAEHREIDDDTARLIANVLGRAVGTESSLAAFGSTGEGDYIALRDEYLAIYTSPDTPPQVKTWIDWLGASLVAREHIGSGRSFVNEHLSPRLDELLVRTRITVGSERFLVHVPASCSSDDLAAVVAELKQLRLPEDEALQAFLTLPDVNAATGDLMESFHDSYVRGYVDVVEAVRDLGELDGLEWDATYAATQHGYPAEAVSIEYELIEEVVRDRYSFVEHRGQIYVFNK